MGARLGVLVVAVMLCGAGLSCRQANEVGPQSSSALSEADMRHAAEIQALIKDLQLDIVNSDENFERYHAAKAKLPTVITEDDVLVVERLMVRGDYRDLSKDVRGKGGWQPRVYVSQKEHDRLDAQQSLSSALADILRDYYIRTNSPQARDVFLRILRERDALHFYAIEGFFESQTVDIKGMEHFRQKIGRDVFVPGTEKTDWLETVHREYLAFEKLEASLEAARQLYLSDKYKDEAVWFFCAVLKDETKECSQHAIEMIAYLNGYQWTRRECAFTLAFEYLEMCARSAQNLEVLRQYVIPWAKYIQSHGAEKTRWVTRTTLDPFNLEYTAVNRAAIPEGTPVPPKPATVIDPSAGRTGGSAP